MLKKRKLLGAACFFILLTACQSNEDTESTGESKENNIEEIEPNQENNDSIEESENQSTKNQKEKNMNGDLSEEQVSNRVKEKDYASEEEAIAAIEEYQIIEQANTDLGYGIEALSEGAAGHEYISWNEGNWLFKIDFPLDPQYAVEGYDDGQSMAQDIVKYLEDNILPPPSERGVVKIRGFEEHPETIIRWQDGTTVYEIEQKTSNPMETLQIAVDYQKNRE